MARKPMVTGNSGEMVAASAILIEGRHFERGQRIEGVSESEVRKAVSIGRVVTAEQLAARAAPPPAAKDVVAGREEPEGEEEPEQGAGD